MAINASLPIQAAHDVTYFQFQITATFFYLPFVYIKHSHLQISTNSYSKFSGPKCIRFWKDIQDMRNKFVLDFRYIAGIQNNGKNVENCSQILDFSPL